MSRILAFAALLAVVSCATGPYKPYAREVKKKPGMEGVIALKPEFITEDRTFADTLMAKNCGTKPVNVLEEGEVAVGQTTSSNSQVRKEKEDNGFNMGGMKFLTGGQTDVDNKAAQSTTTAIKEWQISYNCQTEVAKATPKTKKK